MMDVLKFLAQKGHKTLSPSWYNIISLWQKWYKGKTPFHSYRVYNGSKFVGCKRKTLGMAKQVSEDKADLLMNEKVAITIPADQDFLDAVLSENDFEEKGNELIEKVAALGTGAFVEYLEGSDTCIDYVTAPCIFPLSWRNRRITECAFASPLTDKGIDGWYINIHKLEDGLYVVLNFMTDDKGNDIPLPEDVLPRWETKSPYPLFQIVRLSTANNIEEQNPMGISIFANAIDVLEGVDLVYDSYDNEFNLGKKRIFVNDRVVKIDFESGKNTPIFDPNDTVFYGLPGIEGDGKKAITESDMTLRVQDHDTALQSRLDVLSEKCGFGKGYYKFDASGVKTATEVVSENSKLFRKIKKDEIPLRRALTDMVRAILFLGGKDPEAEVSVSFDDSIIEDTDAVAKRALLELQSGIIDSVEYFKKVYGLEQKAAEKLATAIAKRIAKTQSSGDDLNFFDEGDGADEAQRVDSQEVKETAEKATGERLNGAQVRSLMEVISSYSGGAITENAAINLIVTAFAMTEAEARTLLGLGNA